MRSKLSNRFLANYFLMFIISTIIAICAFLLMSFAGHVLERTLRKNNFTANSLMQDDFTKIDSSAVVENGGGVQVIDAKGEIVYSEGISVFEKPALTITELTEFLTKSQSTGIKFSHSVAYNEAGHFWLVVSFPTSIRIDFAIASNTQYPSQDTQSVVTVIVAVALFYFLLLLVVTFIYSKISSVGIVSPLKQLSHSVRRFQDGDYSIRVDLNLKNEFKDLQDAFNDMAARIEKEMALRKQSENNRRKLILDISHDLKTPLSGMMGYSELCFQNHNLTDEQRNAYLKTIYNNSVKANNLIIDMFELSKLDSPEFELKKVPINICEFLREEIAGLIPQLEGAGLHYEFEIPEREIIAQVDTRCFGRLLENLTSNAVKYTPKGTTVYIGLEEANENIVLKFADNGGGIPEALRDEIFNPFVRTASDRSTETGGTGLGLAIVQKIVHAHGGKIILDTLESKGCRFTITLPKKDLRMI